MPTTTPLTDAIQALTTYANEVTGASDTTLSEAVATLAAGYGQGGVTESVWMDAEEPNDNNIHLWICLSDPSNLTRPFFIQGTGTIDFGDGSTGSLSNATNYGVTHTYSQTGVYHVTVSGTLLKLPANNPIVSGGTNSTGRGDLRRAYLPSSITGVLGQYKLQNKYGLEKLTIKCTGNIGKYCALNAYLLREIIIPEGVATIEESAFEATYSCRNVVIPSTCTSIGARAFYQSGTNQYHIRATTPPTLANVNAFSAASGMSRTIYVPYSEDHSVLSAYQSAATWSTLASIIQEEPQG